MLKERELRVVYGYLLVLGIICSLFFLFEVFSADIDPEYRFWGIAIIFISLIPIVSYLMGNKQKIPFLPLIGLHYIISFGLPVFFMDLDEFYLGRLELKSLVVGFFSVLIFYCLFYITSVLISFKISYNPFREKDTDNIRFLKWTMYFFGLVTIIARLFSLSLLYHFTEPSLYVFSGIFIFLKHQNKINSKESLAIISLLVLEVFFRTLSGMLANTAVYLLYILIVQYTVSKKVNFALIITFLVFYSLLYPVKYQFRELVWFSGRQYSTIEKAVLMKDLALQNLNESERIIKKNEEEEEPFLGRFSYPLSALSFVQSRTPEVTPYWDGYTFMPLFSKFIPRLFWPDKPTENIGQEFGRRYGLLDWHDTGTSMNLPWMAELYANWGERGAYIGYALFGIFFAFLDKYFNKAGSSHLNLIVSAAIIFQLVTHESNFSLQVGNIPLLAVALVIFIKIIRKYVIA
jgi:hypothetical protein